MLAEAAAEEAAAAAALGVRRVGTMEDLTCIDEDLGDGYTSVHCAPSFCVSIFRIDLDVDLTLTLTLMYVTSAVRDTSAR